MRYFHQTLLIAILCSMGLVSAVHAESDTVKNPDPYENLNRKTHAFNETLDKYIARPAAKIYTNTLPDPVEKGVVNFFSNLDELTNIANSLLQAKFGQAANDTGRFLINSTLGIGGLFDVASQAGLPKGEGEDFGQTLGAWGVGEGPYLMLPLIGPSTLRDAPARYIDSFANPVSELEDVSARNSLRLLGLVSTRAELLGLDDAISGDSYLFVRDVYLQRREYLVNDGAIEDDFGDLDDY
ncbi:MAG: MlaA family lipoprotein [Porticoccaceae bacterium]